MQKAIEAELHRQAVLEETDRYLSDLVDRVGEPSAAARAKADALSRRIQRRGADASTSSLPSREVPC